jgi:hypothetical protein
MHPGLQENIVEEVVNRRSSCLSAAYMLASMSRYQVKTGSSIIAAAADMSFVND